MDFHDYQKVEEYSLSQCWAQFSIEKLFSSLSDPAALSMGMEDRHKKTNRKLMLVLNITYGKYILACDHVKSETEMNTFFKKLS